MARINSYSLKTPVSKRDKWIGTGDSGLTKNFTPENIGNYFNMENKIAIGGQLNFIFQSEPGTRQSGSISFNSFGGSNTLLSDLTTFKISENAHTSILAINYMLTLVGNDILIQQVDNPNVFGKYTLVSLIDDGNGFYDATVLPIETNGVLTGGEYYSLSQIISADYIKKETLTQAEYDAIVTKDPNKLYIIIT